MIKRIFVKHFYKHKFMKKCIFDNYFLIDKNTDFEGKNRLSDNTVLLNSKLGYASYVGKQTFLKNTRIGRYTCIAGNVKTIIGTHPLNDFVSIHPAFYSLAKQSGFTYASKNIFNEINFLDDKERISVIIGNDCWICENVSIIEGVTIGDGAVVAAGAIVTKDVEPYAVVAGVPAKVIKKRYSESIIKSLLDFKWWNQDEKWIINNYNLFSDITEFVKFIDRKEV